VLLGVARQRAHPRIVNEVAQPGQTGGVRIVTLGPGDDDLLARALGAFRGPDDRPDPAFLADPSALAVVALEDETVTGWAWGHELGRPDGLRRFILEELETEEAARRDGVGRLLLDAVVAHARERGLTAMWLYTHAGTDAAARLYPGAGGEPGPKQGFWWVFE
jgi:GNAT superfamily N-acetyltransferase